jgi:hypothetical protein
MSSLDGVSLSVATAELHVRLERLKREVDRPVPLPRDVFALYEELCRRVRAQRVQL